jgi:surface protein
MSNLFRQCNNLTKVTFGSDFDTSKVTKMDYMFFDCEELIELDLSSFNLERVTNTYLMFGLCFKLKRIKMNNNTRTNNLEDMSYMFSNCKSLEYINTEIFKVNKITSLNYTFANCYSLKELDFPIWN